MKILPVKNASADSEVEIDITSLTASQRGLSAIVHLRTLPDDGNESRVFQIILSYSELHEMLNYLKLGNLTEAAREFGPQHWQAFIDATAEVHKAITEQALESCEKLSDIVEMLIIAAHQPSREVVLIDKTRQKIEITKRDLECRQAFMKPRI